jgi:hypothetical protein
MPSLLGSVLRLARQLLASCAAALAVSTLPGCFGTTSTYVEADVPVDVEAYPRTYYDGHVVYWVGDRWYVQDRGAWFYYRSEPAHLRHYRAYWHDNYVSPRRERHYYRPYQYSDRRAAPPARRQAPPARRRAPAVWRR